MAMAGPDVAGPGAGRARSLWAAHRRRAEVLRERHPFAAEVLALYLALADVWEDGWDAARAEQPEPRQLARWAAERTVPWVVKATEAAGPRTLAAATRDLLGAGRPEEPLAAWLAGGELPPAERYLARASLHAPLVALAGEAGAACTEDPSPRGERRCPGCGGPPQLSFRSHAEDPLVSGGRRLACARCGQSWSYSASSCPSCGETSGARRTVYAERRAGPLVGRGGRDRDTAGGAGAEAPTFPHLRIDACASCERYLLDVDLSRDPRAVPEVDELAALPLDLYAAGCGLSKITPNLMGF
jgi:Protein involved in formate dehydrogenase formation